MRTKCYLFFFFFFFSSWKMKHSTLLISSCIMPKKKICGRRSLRRDEKKTLLLMKGRVNTEGIYNILKHFERLLLCLSCAISRNKPTLFMFSPWTRWRQEWNRARGSFLLYFSTFFILNFAFIVFRWKEVLHMIIKASDTAIITAFSRRFGRFLPSPSAFLKYFRSIPLGIRVERCRLPLFSLFFP